MVLESLLAYWATMGLLANGLRTARHVGKAASFLLNGQLPAMGGEILAAAVHPTVDMGKQAGCFVLETTAAIWKPMLSNAATDACFGTVVKDQCEQRVPTPAVVSTAFDDGFSSTIKKIVPEDLQCMLAMAVPGCTTPPPVVKAA